MTPRTLILMKAFWFYGRFFDAMSFSRFALLSQKSQFTHQIFSIVWLPRDIIFPTAVPDPQYILPIRLLTISSFGYLLWRNKRHCYPFYYSTKKSQQEDLNSHPENKQCNAVLHVALPTALRAADGSKGGLTNIYLGLNHPRWIGCTSKWVRAVSDWLYANEFVLGSGTAVGKII